MTSILSEPPRRTGGSVMVPALSDPGGVRPVVARWTITGELILETATHLGGGVGDVADRVLIRDARTGRPHLPGTSIAGALRSHPGTLPRSPIITTVRLALAGRPMPRIEDAVRIGELVRLAAIRTADRIANSRNIPVEISGHAPAEELNHQHAFHLPEDADGDAFIDHVLIHAPGGLSAHAVRAFDAIAKLWTRDGEEWAVVFEGAWASPGESGSAYAGMGRRWVSVTPYLHPWYAKRGFGLAEQVLRECAQRGMPAPRTVRRLPSISIRGRERQPMHFHRFRSKRGLRQPDRHGSMLELTFDEPLRGPLALGFACHYGLGIFMPAG